jgi:hypothetical protein
MKCKDSLIIFINELTNPLYSGIILLIASKKNRLPVHNTQVKKQKNESPESMIHIKDQRLKAELSSFRSYLGSRKK